MNSFRTLIQKIIVVSASFALVFSFSMPAFAALNAGNTGLSAAAPSSLSHTCTSASCLADIIGRFLNIALSLVGVILVCLLLWAGFLWMTAGGEEDKVKKAKGMIANAAAGIVIIALAYAVTGFVIDSLSFSLTGTAATPAPTPPCVPVAPATTC